EFPGSLDRFVGNEKGLSLEDAIHKMTGMPAARLGLSDRGQIRAGLAADLVVFDLARVRDRATNPWPHAYPFENYPHDYPEGIDWVLVNGQLAVADGEFTGARAGIVLRHRGAGPISGLMAEPALSGRTTPDRDDHLGRQETIPRQEDSEERLPYPAGQCPVFDVDRRSGKPSPHQHSVLLLFAGPELLLPLRPRFAALQERRAESIDGYDGHELVADVGSRRPRDPVVRGVPSSPRTGRERGGAAVRFSLSRVRDVA